VIWDVGSPHLRTNGLVQSGSRRAVWNRTSYDERKGPLVPVKSTAARTSRPTRTYRTELASRAIGESLPVGGIVSIEAVGRVGTNYPSWDSATYCTGGFSGASSKVPATGRDVSRRNLHVQTTDGHSSHTLVFRFPCRVCKMFTGGHGRDCRAVAYVCVCIYIYIYIYIYIVTF
jgi:hypothetical protein